MNRRIVAGSTALLACFLGWAPPLPAAPGPGHTAKSSPGAKMNGAETRQQTGGRDGVKNTGDQSPERTCPRIGLGRTGSPTRHG